MLLFEGGKSLDLNLQVTEEAVEGTKRFLDHLEVLNPRKKATKKDILQTTLYDLPDISLFHITLLIQFHNHQSILNLSWQSFVISDIPKNFSNINII